MLQKMGLLVVEAIHELALRCLFYSVDYEKIMKRLNNACK
ncbi:hypothetical protein APA_3682 [Pseudanabaena sp. lw0831]|nr:hypothetical protein APA_3682 [Pseudanabaena sp. lw0831]